jgi:hypothetical protein
VSYTEVTIAAGKEACVTRGQDDDYVYDEKVVVKVSARVFGKSVQYDRMEKMSSSEAASDLVVFGGE